MPRKKVAHTDTLNWRAEVYQLGGNPSREDIKSYPSAKQMDKMYDLLWKSPNQGASIVEAILDSRPSGKPYKAAWTVPCNTKKALKGVLPNAVELEVSHSIVSAPLVDGELHEDHYGIGCPSSLKDLFNMIEEHLGQGQVTSWEIKGKKDSLAIVIIEQDGDFENYQAFVEELEADLEAWENGEDHILDYDNVWYNYAAGEGIKEEDLWNGMAEELGYSITSKNDVGYEYIHEITITGAIDPAFIGNIKPQYDFDLSFLKMAIIWGWEKPFELSREAGR